VLVVDQAAAARQRVWHAIRRADQDECHWFEAADADTARRTLALSEIDLVVVDSYNFRHSLHGWTDSATAGRGRPAPLIVVLSNNDEPQGIQQILDAGAECCLSQHLPQHILEGELRRLVAQVRRKARLS
jgi:DNA-binding NarL/FixJ family response regulator